MKLYVILALLIAGTASARILSGSGDSPPVGWGERDVLQGGCSNDMFKSANDGTRGDLTKWINYKSAQNSESWCNRRCKCPCASVCGNALSEVSNACDDDRALPPDALTFESAVLDPADVFKADNCGATSSVECYEANTDQNRDGSVVYNRVYAPWTMTASIMGGIKSCCAQAARQSKESELQACNKNFVEKTLENADFAKSSSFQLPSRFGPALLGPESSWGNGKLKLLFDLKALAGSGPGPLPLPGPLPTQLNPFEEADDLISLMEETDSAHV